MNVQPRTIGVDTVDGFVPHKQHQLGFDCPVKVETESFGDTTGRRYVVIVMREANKKPISLPAPLRSLDGRLVYALPGGGEWAP